MPITSAITGGLSCDNSFLALSGNESFIAENRSRPERFS